MRGRTSARGQATYYAPGWQDPLRPQQPLVSLRWLLGAVAVTVAVAAFCAYAVLCLLFYQGQWQMLFHPSRSITATPASAGLEFQPIRFDYNELGQPQLNGWWIPAAPGSKYVQSTILYLHPGSGSLSDSVPQLGLLHSAGINLFAIDYRGFGQSAGAHPTERQAQDDAAAAWTYLTGIRHLAPSQIVVYGDGAGASFAANLATRHPVAGLILEDIGPTAHSIFMQDARARLIPLSLLAKERLDPSGELASLATPKLFLDTGAADRTRADFSVAHPPKQYFAVQNGTASETLSSLTRFLGEVLR